jgi:hypothetical protein
MSKVIFLSLFIALCSTVFVQPWFLSSLLKRGTIIGDEYHRGFSGRPGKIAKMMKIQVCFFTFTLIVSLIMYLIFGINFKSSILQFELVVLFTLITLHYGWRKHYHLKIKIGIAIMVLLLVLLFI